MSYLFSTIKDYIRPQTTTNADSADESSTGSSNISTPQKDTLAPATTAAPHPYANNANSNQNRIMVESPASKNTLSIPAVSLNSLQPPIIRTNSSDGASDDSDSDSENDSSEFKIATPYLASSTAIDTPFMTLSTADDPDSTFFVSIQLVQCHFVGEVSVLHISLILGSIRSAAATKTCCGVFIPVCFSCQ
jgi:hypothetical protein